MNNQPKALKNCKHCMTEISRRARVCPQCQLPVSAFSSVTRFFSTGIWILAAIVSFGFAAFEKAEKYGYSDELAKLVQELELANMTNSILQSEFSNPTAPPPAWLDSGEFAVNDDPRILDGQPQAIVGRPRTVAAAQPAAIDPEELFRIENKIREVLAAEPRDDVLLKRLIRRQQYLKRIEQ